MEDKLKIGGACCSFISWIWGLLCMGFAISHLRQARGEFEQIINSIPEPQIRTLNDNKFHGPVHVICSPPLVQNYSNVTCSDIFNRYKPVTSTQQYFSWLYLNPASRPHRIDHMTTIHDITHGRKSLFIYLAIVVAVTCIFKIVPKLVAAKNDSDFKRYGCDTFVAAVFAAINAMFGVNVMHMFMCNLFSVSEYEHGVFLLQYIPVYAYWAALISTGAASCVFGCYIGCVLGASYDYEEGEFRDDDYIDKLEAFYFVALIVIFLAFIYILWGFSGYGLFYYIWNFSATFEAKSAGGAIVFLKPDYIESIGALEKIANAVGGLALFDVVNDVLVVFS